MSEIYNEEYYRQYDVGIGKVDYQHADMLKKFLSGVAERIAEDFKPRTVLDAGCATGHLVAALRDLGIEAYGIDISEYAVSKVREDVRPFCRVGSLTEEFPADLPKRYDLIVSIEVLEHLYAEDGKKAIANLCRHTDTVLFSSTPDDFTERTHVNVQQREYWARLFFEQGFTDDINYRPKYLTAYASLFRKNADMARQVEDYERNIRMIEGENEKNIAALNQAVQDKETHIRNLTAQHSAEQNEWTTRENDLNANIRKLEQDVQVREKTIAEQEDKLESIAQELAHYTEHYHSAIAQRENLKRQLAEAQNAYNVISNAFFWKITKPARVLADAIKKPLRHIAALRLLNKGIRCLHENGWRYTWEKVKRKIKNQQDFAAVAKKPLFTERELAEQRNHRFEREIKFSIVVPLFNTPEKFLREMIQSVIDQTYSDWELCMADGSDAQHSDVERICRQYTKKDSRIKYKKLEKNLGISGNTNACLEMATGDYIGLFDHDDLLHPAALYEVMRAICEQGADFIYTDENTFHNSPQDAYCPHFKPDFSPDTLRSYNYICHFVVFRHELMNDAGKFRSEFDGSQDYDMVLRLTEKAKKIVHIPEILYYWRAHQNSVASDISAKPYTLNAAKKALTEHLEREHLDGEVMDSAIPSTYKIQYAIKKNSKVSIVIPNMDHIEVLRTCIDSILDKTTYENYEIIIIENNSKNEETFSYYRELEKNSCVKIVNWIGKFNYSAINNFGVQQAVTGEYIILLNNDIEVITPDWIEQMLMFAQRTDVGAVGAMLYYPDETIQHAGVILGVGGVAGHSHKNFNRGSYGYMSRATIVQNLSAVTFACVMIPRNVWDEVGGLDESFAVAFNDVDMCMRIRKAGYLIVWTPYAELYHYESKSRGLEDTPEKKKRFEGEVMRFQERWKDELAAGDPYYNPNLSLEREDFSLK